MQTAWPSIVEALIS